VNVSALARSDTFDVSWIQREDCSLGDFIHAGNIRALTPAATYTGCCLGQ